MEFDDHDDDEHHEEEMELTESYESLRLNNITPVTTDGVVSVNVITTQAQTRKPKYRECLKNQAVGIGGHAVDGCGEFLAAGAEGTLDGLKCAACNCHRNFHRKETFDSSGEIVPHQVLQFTPYYRTPYLHHLASAQQQQQRPLALPSPSGGGRDLEEEYGLLRKRHRTKFSQEQKEKMLGLADKLGWRIQKHDEEIVEQFYHDTGVKRNVLKIWMHNNKHTLGRKP